MAQLRSGAADDASAWSKDTPQLELESRCVRDTELWEIADARRCTAPSEPRQPHTMAISRLAGSPWAPPPLLMLYALDAVSGQAAAAAAAEQAAAW